MSRVRANRYVLYLLPAVIGVTADLLTKAWVFSWPELRMPGAVHWVWTNHVGIQLSLNEGALFGLGQGQVLVFAALSLSALIAIPVWLFWFRACQDGVLTAIMGAITGGILGNLYDRLGLPNEVWAGPNERVGERVYAVRDWILFQWNDQWQWPNFNLADSLLVVGAGVLILHIFFQRPSNNVALRDDRYQETSLG